MHDDKLIRMANQIGAFFESMPNRQEGVQGVAKHLKNFWDPRMRKALLLQVNGPAAQGCSAIVLEAVRQHRELLA